MPGQRAARASVHRELVPDWASVASAYDGVHVSWAGFLTSEGCVTDLGRGDVTMMRYWFSERTRWLRDVFGEPLPLKAPDVETDGTAIELCDVRTDPARRRDDETTRRSWPPSSAAPTRKQQPGDIGWAEPLAVAV